MRQGKRLHKRTGVLAVLLILILGFALPGSSLAAETVKLGALLPMTGSLQSYGEPCLSGIKLAQQQINEAGGVLGSELQISVGDTQTKPQPGIDAAQKLVSLQGVSGIVGALSSGVSIPVARSVSSKEKAPQISPASTSPVITGLQDNDFMFRSVPSDALQGVAMAQVVANQSDFTNTAILYVNNDYGEGLADNFKKAYEKKGGKVSASLAYEPGKASYRGELSQAAAEGAKALVLIGYPKNGVTILRQALEEGYFQDFVYSDGLKAPEIIEAIGAKYLNGSFGTAPQAVKDTDSAQKYLSAYKDEYGEVPPKPFIDTSYDATFVLALAVEKAGSTDSVEVRDALRAVANPPGEKILAGEWEKARRLLEQGKDINYTGASGSINFDKAGDVSGSFAHWRIEDGEIVTVKVFKPEMD